MTLPSLAISMTAYNDEATIESLIRESIRVLDTLKTPYNVVVINDGSKDRTKDILDSLSRELPALQVIHHPQNLGFGQTLKDVFQKPTQEAVFFIPGDGQIGPEEIHKLLPALENSDFILGWRKSRKDGLRRAVLSGFYNGLVSWRLGRKVNDVDSVALVKRSVIEAIHFKNNSAFFHAEFLLETARLGFRWTEVPIEHRPRLTGKSTVFRWKVLRPALRDLILYFLTPRPSK